jgi:XTP/dITP diphosphohydrolase
VLDGVPFGQPALALAAQLQRRAERAGVPAELGDLPGADRVSEPEGAPEASGKHDAPVSEIGAQLFALVARARAAGRDPELELRAAARAYRDRVLAWEQSSRP